MSTPPLLEAAAIRVEREGRTLLHEASIDLAPGEMQVLLGANGAGKSTLLKALSGEWPCAAGQVRLGGRDLKDWSLREQAQQRAVLPQHDLLQFGFTVREVVALGRHARRQPSALAESALLTAVMQATGIADFAERRYPTLSGGERRLVQLARVLAQVWDATPPLLLLDEPVAGLDPAHQHQVLTLLRQLAARGAGILLSLHELHLAAAYADRISLLREGRVLASGRTDSVLSEAALQATYGRSLRFEALPQGDRWHWLIAPQD